MIGRLEVSPDVADVEELGLEVRQGEEPWIQTATHVLANGDSVEITWDEVATAVSLRWRNETGDVLSIVREHARGLTISGENQQIHARVWSGGDDWTGQLLVSIGETITIDDSVLES